MLALCSISLFSYVWFSARASVLIPADFDFIGCFPSATRWFFRQNHRISTWVVLCGNAISKVNATTTTMGKTKWENQEIKNSEHATHFLAGFLSGIAWLALPNLIEVAMRLLRLLFRHWLFIIFISRNTSSHLLLV